MIAELIKNEKSVSAYQPASQAIIDLTFEDQKEYQCGYEILHKSWTELNNYSVIDRMNKDQRTFNSFVDESVDNPDDAWKWRGTRSMARNRVMAMHAHLTMNYAKPGIFAQNDMQEEDRDMAEVQESCIQWTIDNSNYKPSFLVATMGMLVNPVTYISPEYCEVYQKVKYPTDTGIETKEVMDSILSGPQFPVYTADQVLITNAYEQNIQRQRTVIKRKYIEYADARAKYKDHPNWQYVQAGIKSIYNEEDGLFYDVKDEDHPYLVEEAIFSHRMDDSEVPYINGIYMGDDNVEHNMIKHRDPTGAPKYNVVPFGYERIGEHFYFFKSLVNRVGWDHQLLDALYEVGMNKEFLQAEMPVAVSGSDPIDRSIAFPGAVVAFEDKDTKVTPLLPQVNTASIWNAMREAENSMSEASVSDVQSGQLPQASQKAYSVARAEQNAQILLTGVGKTLGLSMVQLGELMVDMNLQHLTVPQIDEITGNPKYRSFFLERQVVDGKEVSKNIIFDDALIGKHMSDDEIEEYNLKLAERSGYPEGKGHLYMVNPHLFSKMKYLIRMEMDQLLPKNEASTQALMTELYTLFRADPLINAETLVRKVAYSFFKGEADELMAEQAQNVMGAPMQVQGSQLGAQAKSTQLGQMTQATPGLVG